MPVNISDNKKIPVVLIATGIMNAGGTESLIMELLRHSTGRVQYKMLIHHGGQIRKGVFDDEIRQMGVELYYIPSVGTCGITKYIRSFKSVIAEIGKIDIIHSHLNGAGGIISLAAKLAGIRHRICHCHADIHFTGTMMGIVKSEVQLWGMKMLIELFATERWACSQSAWTRLYMPWRKKIIINNMIDARKYLTSSYLKENSKQKFKLIGKNIVGAVGRVAPIKNYELILKAIVNCNVHFVCFGRFDPKNSYCSKLISLSKELGIEERVHWLGNTNKVHEDIHCIDLFVMPSFTEGFGMAAIEAQAAGIQCLLSDGVPKEVDVNVGLVKFLNPNSHKDWESEIQSAFTSSPIRVSNELLIKEFQAKGFDSIKGVEEIENQYLSLI